MKEGHLLREVVDEIEKSLILENAKDFQELSKIYEQFIGQLQNEKSAGEFYTPRSDNGFCCGVFKATNMR
ncbi:hypothetical protein [Campylobacter helveticus]|uniref:hypothetical protein n=1 Tax=Campylobacter helveticus TaxID=28898 RepID=UPI00214A5C87|nr:hypothetical protein [Campylobacter helveticus]MCR2057007.1 hypothetical protein [Campylobacter helveticus]MCR2066822.1 hypothetical protein [Campylobacter helveticus]